MADRSTSEYLSRTPIFSSLDQAELEELAPLVFLRKLPGDTVIFHENDPASAFYMVKSGKVKIYKLSREGREQVLTILGEGQIFGDVPVFDGGPYPATAATLEPSELLLVRSGDFQHLLRQHPDIAVKVIKVLGQRLRQAMELIRDLSFKQVPHRLAGLLLKLAIEEGSATDAGIVVDLGMSRQEIADVVGTSRETVTRELKKMEKAGLIDIDRRRVLVSDEQRLKNWAR